MMALLRYNYLMTFDYETYLSPFTWRYGSPEMRHIWSETNKRRLWRKIWVALAEVQSHFGLVTAEQVDDLRAHMDQVDVPRALEIEAQIHHDLMAELKTFAEQSKIAGGIIHLGATSTDIEDNADVLRLRQSMDLVLGKLRDLLLSLATRIETWADTPMMAFTHIQPAEPSTLGYRLASYAQDLLEDWEQLVNIREELRGKGFKGAVGTSASYAELLGADQLSEFEARLSEKLNLPFYLVTTQVYPRKQDYGLIGGLGGLGATLYKFAFDLRILQSPAVGELGEPFAQMQVGSSAMPFKRNPINAEKIDSLGRALAQMPRLAWDNAAHSLLERTLDDSANRRTMLPEAFLISDELLSVAQRIVDGLRVDKDALARNLSKYGPFAAQERVLMALVGAGADRQEMHERLRQHALEAWRAVQAGDEYPLVERISQDLEIRRYLSVDQVVGLMDASEHVGDAPQRARRFVEVLRGRLGTS